MLATAVPAACADAGTAVRGAIENYVKPGYAAFHAAGAALRDDVAALCASPSPAALEEARGGFREAVRAWSAIELVRFGPVAEDNRLERILFWPDRKSTGLKQVQAALAQEDATATDPATLSGKSVAMQGLGALEFVLFGTGAETLSENAGYRCAYGRAIATNIDSISATIEAGWGAPDGFAQRWSSPGPDNPFYRDQTEALNELLAVFVNGLELMRDQRLGGFLGGSAAEDKPKQALFWRSGETVPSLRANLAALRALFDAAALDDLLPGDQNWIAQSIGFEFGNGLAALDAASGPVTKALADGTLRDKLGYFRVVTTSLSELFGTRLSGELGLSAGFSSLDGD
jgi:predicted lipoprotein